MCDRHFGVGADGVILVLPSRRADVRMRIFNSDGSEAEMCGNGIRGLSKYVYERNLVRKRVLRVETKAGIKTLANTVRRGRVCSVRVDMGEPGLDRSQVPMKGPLGRVVEEPFFLDGAEFRITALSMGNPHCVVFVNDVEGFPVAEIGPRIENHPVFPNRTNVEFVQVVNSRELMVRTWERGAGETLACGTGASAVCVAGVLTSRSQRKVRIHLRGGTLDVEWSADGRVYLTGPVAEVFEGVWLGSR
jgi:diaminopimelate epimerase